MVFTELDTDWDDYYNQHRASGKPTSLYQGKKKYKPDFAETRKSSSPCGLDLANTSCNK